MSMYSVPPYQTPAFVQPQLPPLLPLSYIRFSSSPLPAQSFGTLPVTIRLNLFYNLRHSTVLYLTHWSRLLLVVKRGTRVLYLKRFRGRSHLRTNDFYVSSLSCRYPFAPPNRLNQPSGTACVSFGSPNLLSSRRPSSIHQSVRLINGFDRALTSRIE